MAIERRNRTATLTEMDSYWGGEKEEQTMSKRTNRTRKPPITLPVGYVEAARRELEIAALAYANHAGAPGPETAAELAWLTRELQAAAFHFGSAAVVERTGSFVWIRRLRGAAAITHSETTGQPLNCWATSWGQAFRDNMTATEAREYEDNNRRRLAEWKKRGLDLSHYDWEQIFVDVADPNARDLPER